MRNRKVAPSSCQRRKRIRAESRH